MYEEIIKDNIEYDHFPASVPPQKLLAIAMHDWVNNLFERFQFGWLAQPGDGSKLHEGDPAA